MKLALDVVGWIATAAFVFGFWAFELGDAAEWRGLPDAGNMVDSARMQWRWSRGPDIVPY